MNYEHTTDISYLNALVEAFFARNNITLPDTPCSLIITVFPNYKWRRESDRTVIGVCGYTYTIAQRPQTGIIPPEEITGRIASIDTMNYPKSFIIGLNNDTDQIKPFENLYSEEEISVLTLILGGGDSQRIPMQVPMQQVAVLEH